MSVPAAVTTIDLLHDRKLKALLRLAGAPASALPETPTSPAAGLAELVAHFDAISNGRLESASALFAAVCRPHAGEARLREIKDLAKALIPKAATAPQRSAAMLLYHAAVAAALVHLGRSISSSGREGRRALYRQLAERLTGTPPGQVFAQAAERLLEQESSGKRGRMA